MTPPSQAWTTVPPGGGGAGGRGVGPGDPFPPPVVAEPRSRVGTAYALELQPAPWSEDPPHAPPHLRRRARPRGFTLLEVLVALAILSLAIVVTIQGFAQGLRLLKLSGDHQEAMSLADQKAREALVPVAGLDEGTEGVFRWERTTKAVDAPDLRPAGTAQPRWNVYEITVKVSWGGARHVEVTTLRTVSAAAEAADRARPGGPTPGAPSR